MDSVTRNRRPMNAQRKAWAKPAATRLRAGAAEFQQTNNTDNFISSS
jgi:hypothetical protein